MDVPAKLFRTKRAFHVFLDLDPRQTRGEIKVIHAETATAGAKKFKT
jgi:hypothetical protein